MIAETMEASSVMNVNTAPEAFQSDEGFVEPKQGLSDEKESYEVGSISFSSFAEICMA